MLEVKPTSQHGRMTTRSGQNGNEADASAALYALAR